MSLFPANIQAPNAEILQRRTNALRSDAAVVEWFSEKGISAANVEALQLGMHSQKEAKAGKRYHRAISMPIRSREGLKNKYVYLEMSGITQNAPGETWSTGQPETHFWRELAGQSTVVVCEMKDFLAVSQLVAGMGNDHMVQVIASTQKGLPSEWMNPNFWDVWEKIFVAVQKGPEDLATTIMRAASKTVLRLLPSDAESWFQRVSVDHAQGEFERSFAEAEKVSENILSHDQAGRLGRVAYEPVDVGRCYHDGHLYYPTRTLMREVHTNNDGTVAKVERIETVVIRSDGRVLTAKQMPAKPGTSLEDRVWRLTDGILIDEAPSPSRNASWSWESIEKWRHAREKGHVVVRKLSDILVDLRAALTDAVWLPFEEDYSTLALVVAASYVQPVFKAVPYVLVCGDRGTGKSQLGIVLSQIGCNGNVIGQISAASAARIMHEGRGLTVFDDLEGIGPKRGNDGSFMEFVQWLKVSYNADTAKKPWTDSGSGFRVRTLNGFGIKVINNTLGVDGILGSRMIRVPTQRMPNEIARKRSQVRPKMMNHRTLRNELHVWAFENIKTVDLTYCDQVPPNQRDEEIAAPLRVLAKIAGNSRVSEDLERSLARSAQMATQENDGPPDIIREAVINLVRRGQYWVSATLVAMEARRMVGPNFGKSFSSELTEIDDEKVVGRFLSSLGLVEGDQIRRRIHNRQMRFSRVSAGIVEEVFDGSARAQDMGIDGFCKECSACSYSSQKCSIMQRRNI